ncbi:MAG TPA: lysophospholipid acyltransferase family protein [Candidatus Omnitrophota bacterium]|nr:lysophospholipid acyltransferase family protein [Candidatus Omnitrophota bacterium]HPT07967.1 lysophospholipid acyltransferase family protein [Candidatus Omnitrophota bacterium]
MIYFLYQLVRPLMILWCKICFHLHVEGTKNIPSHGGFILACNHVSYLDPVFLGASCPRKLNFMARKELFENKFFGPFITGLNAFPVKRDSADIGALKEALKRVKRGGCLVVFPEATRKSGPEDVDPKAGIGFIAAKAQAPIIPCFITGAEKVLPKGAKRITMAPVSVKYGKQILIERGMPYQDVADHIMVQIRHLAC